MPTPGAVDVLSRALERGVGAAACTSMGRLFDGVASLLGLRHRIRFSAQAAIELEGIATPHGDRLYSLRFTQTTTDCLSFDWGPMICEIVQDARRGVAPGEIAAAFHGTLAEAAVALTGEAAGGPVFLTGGCFQNRRLAESVAERLRGARRTVHLHRRVPPNDGGLAAGQALAGAFRLGRRRGGRG
jgi:hydrogenase maturation protein HypF